MKSADDMAAVVKRHNHALLIMNGWWNFEHALLLSLCGATAESRASATILAELPTAERRRSIFEAKGALEFLQASEGFKFSPVNCQAGLKFVLKLLDTLHLGIPNEIVVEEVSSLARDCIASFQYFLSREVEPTLNLFTFCF